MPSALGVCVSSRHLCCYGVINGKLAYIYRKSVGSTVEFVVFGLAVSI